MLILLSGDAIGVAFTSIDAFTLIDAFQIIIGVALIFEALFIIGVALIIAGGASIIFNLSFN